jgi:hypothetical protein
VRTLSWGDIEDSSAWPLIWDHYTGISPFTHRIELDLQPFAGINTTACNNWPFSPGESAHENVIGNSINHKTTKNIMKKYLTLLLTLFVSFQLVNAQSSIDVAASLDGYTRDNAVGGFGTAPDGTQDSWAEWDEIRVGNESAALVRSFLLFELPDVAAGDVLSATFKINYDANTVAAPPQAADLYHSAIYNTLPDPDVLIDPPTAIMYDASFSTLVADNFITEGTAFGVLTVDVTSYVVSELTNEGNAAIIALSMQMDNEAGLVGTWNEYFKFGATGTSVPPVLTVTTVPEPSTFALLAGLLAIGIIAVRRRK